jgi:hypothetical protein
MIKGYNKKFSFHLILIILLFLMIAMMSLMIILLGKDIYSSINEDRASNYEKRVSLSYVANKIRQSDKKNNVRIESLYGENAIVINEVYDDVVYETWIYFYDNSIYEIFTDEDMKFNLEDGMKVMESESFVIEEINDNLYKFTAINNDESTELILCLYTY